jgi:Icc-related predicted phosphoesterase
MIKNKTIRKLGIIGDIHGKFDDYLRKIHKFDATIQVGDFGFKETWEKLIYNVDADHHKIVAGNHDDYDYIQTVKPAHNLGDFGKVHFHGLEFWFMRGAYSLDIMYRIPHISWWEQEQLGYMALEQAINNYEREKPEIVITHTIPANLVDVLFENMSDIRCATSIALEQMFEIHKPKLWIFGHFHPYKIFIREVLGCNFIALPELGALEYLSNLTIDENIEIYNKFHK